MDERREIAMIVGISVIGVTVLSLLWFVFMLVWGDDPEFHENLQGQVKNWLQEPEEHRSP